MRMPLCNADNSPCRSLSSHHVRIFETPKAVKTYDLSDMSLTNCSYCKSTNFMTSSLTGVLQIFDGFFYRYTCFV